MSTIEVSKALAPQALEALTSACDQFLEDVPEFQWLTHQAIYSNFPASLLITCVFDTEGCLLRPTSGGINWARRHKAARTKP